MAEPQQKRSISFSVDLDELLRACKVVVAAVAAASLLALVYYYYETLALYCLRPGVLIFLLVNAGVVVIALSSGVTIKGGSPNGSKRSASPVEEDTLIASVLGSESDAAFPGHRGVGEEVEIQQEEREKEKYEAAKPEKEAKMPEKEVRKPKKEAKKDRAAEREKEEAVEKREREIVGEREETVELEVKAFPSFERARTFTTRLFRSSSETITVKPPKAPPAVQIRRRIEESGSQMEDSLKMKKAASVAGEKASSGATATVTTTVTATAAVKDVDKAADDFISRFYQQMKLQRLDSVLRYKNRTD